jgi:hypothetical protein
MEKAQFLDAAPDKCVELDCEYAAMTNVEASSIGAEEVLGFVAENIFFLQTLSHDLSM